MGDSRQRKILLVSSVYLLFDRKVNHFQSVPVDDCMICFSCLFNLIEVAEKITKYIPVNLRLGWDSDFFPTLSLELFFALSTAIL